VSFIFPIHHQTHPLLSKENRVRRKLSPNESTAGTSTKPRKAQTAPRSTTPLADKTLVAGSDFDPLDFL
jgi:hypothetical protein